MADYWFRLRLLVLFSPNTCLVEGQIGTLTSLVGPGVCFQMGSPGFVAWGSSNKNTVPTVCVYTVLDSGEGASGTKSS